MANIEIEKKVELERLRFSVSKMLSGHTLAMTKLDVIRDEIMNGLVYELHTEVMAEKVENRVQKVTFEFPKSWWQYFKKEYFPKWLLKKFPVKSELSSKSVIFNRYATYPQLPLIFPPDKIGRIVYKEYSTIKE